MKLPEFERLGVQVVAGSTDSPYSHLAWLRTPREEGGIAGVTYPIISDFKKEVAEAYGVLHPGGMPLRATFIIDRQGIVQCQLVNNLPIGRSIDEILRLVQAIQHHEKYGEVCPVGWAPGQAGMSPNSEGLRAYLRNQQAENG